MPIALVDFSEAKDLRSPCPKCMGFTHSEFDVPPLYFLLTMLAFHSADNKVALRHVLIVIQEQGVDECAPDSSDDRNGLRCRFFRDNDRESRCYLGNQANDGRGPSKMLSELFRISRNVTADFASS
jgi:hypothetical protein